MEYKCKYFYKIISFISILNCLVIFIFVNSEAVNHKYFTPGDCCVCVFFYLYIVARIFLSIMIIISGINVCCMTFNIIIVLVLMIIALILNFNVGHEDDVSALGTVIPIIGLIDFIFDIICAVPFCRNYKDYNHEGDCLEECFKERKKKNFKRMLKENEILEEENEKLNNLRQKRISYNVEDKKIGVILWYIKNKYNVKFPPDVLYQYLLDEVKNKCGFVIDQNKFQEIFLYYIKEKLDEYLSCPITCDIFLNPVITPEGQTFEKDMIVKEIERNHKNPLTRNELKKKELIENKLVMKLCKILQSNGDNFKIEHFIQIRNLLMNPKTNTLFTNPYVINAGEKIGETDEEDDIVIDYSNKVILNIIEQNSEILTDEFLNYLNGKIDINTHDFIEDTINTEAGLTLNSLN